MTASPWAAPSTIGAAPAYTAAPTVQVAPPTSGPVGIPPANYPGAYQPVPQPPRGSGPRLWPIIVVFTVIVIAAIGITALVTAAIVRSSSASQAPTVSTTPTTPQFSATEQAAAKDKTCRVFDAGQRGNAGQGGFINNGQLNVPVVLRSLNTVVAVQNSITPATPSDLLEAVKKFATAETDLTSAALANLPIDKLNDLTKASNGTIDTLADVCGLPH